MTGFVSRPAAPAAGSPSLVENDGFWPNVDLALLRSDSRIDTTVTIERLREAAVSSIIDANRELKDFKAAQIALGYMTLDAVPTDSVGGEKITAGQYRRAIHSLVSADLIDRQRDTTAVAAGAERAAELEVTADEHRRNYRWAISDLLGIPRTTVELI